VAYFAELYTKARGCEPELDAKERVGANRLLTGRTLDQTKAILDRAFADPFVAAKKPSLAYIASNVNAFQGTAPLAHGRAAAPKQEATGAEPWLREHLT
jgi:hypothetical protein